MDSNPYQSPAAFERPHAVSEHAVPFASGHGRAVVTIAMLLACVGVAGFSAVSDVMQIGLLERIVAGDPNAVAAADANDMRVSLLGIVQVVMLVVTGVCFLTWIHRAHRNLPALGADGLKFTPGWSVGWWFIPVANLWKPFQAVQEVWWGSDPDRDEPNVHDWRHHAGSGPLGWWWAAWIANNLADRVVAGAFADAHTPQEFITGSYAMLGSHALDVVAAGLAIVIVLGIDRRQEQRLRAIDDGRAGCTSIGSGDLSRVVLPHRLLAQQPLQQSDLAGVDHLVHRAPRTQSIFVLQIWCSRSGGRSSRWSGNVASSTSACSWTASSTMRN